MITGRRLAVLLERLAKKARSMPALESKISFTLGDGVTVTFDPEQVVETPRQRAARAAAEARWKPPDDANRDAKVMPRRCESDAKVMRSDAGGASGAALTSSSEDLKNTTTSEPDSSSRARTPAVVVAEIRSESEARPDARAHAELDANAKIVCPENLSLTRGQVRKIQNDHFIPEELIEPLVRRTTSDFVLRWMDDETATRTLNAWRGSLAKAVVGNWKDGDKRRSILSDHKTPADLEKARAHERMLEATERKAAAEDEARRQRLLAKLGPKRVTPPMPDDPVAAIERLTKGMVHTA